MSCNFRVLRRQLSSTKPVMAEATSTNFQSPQVTPKAARFVSKSANGITLATVDYKNALSQLSMVIPAGSKYQHPSELGTAHFLKNYIFKVSLAFNS